MRVLSHELKFKKGSDVATIVHSSCTHFGSSALSDECIENFEARCAEYPWFDLGDMMEAIMPGDIRFGVDRSEATFTNQLSYAKKHVEKNHKTCWGILPGNHEEVISKKMGDVTGFIANEAKVPYLTQTAFVEVICPKGEFVMFLAHGHTTMSGRSGEPERREVNKKIHLRNLLRPFHADICCVGHFHQPICTPPVYEDVLMAVDGEVKKRPVPVYPTWYVAAPAKWKTYDDDSNYGQGKLYRPTGIGWMEIDVMRDGTILQVRRINEQGETIKVFEPEVIG